MGQVTTLAIIGIFVAKNQHLMGKMSSVVLEMVNFTRLCLVKFIPISNTTLVIFIPNFTATHVIPS